MRKPKHFRERHGGLEGLWSFSCCKRAQSIDGAIDAPKPLVNHSPQQRCLRVAGCQFQCVIEIGVRIGQSP